MEPSITSSLIGIIVFSAVMYLGYRYANGKWKVSDEKQSAYDNWNEKYGKMLRRAIIVISILYGILMAFQVSDLIGQ
jgi:hypothetical protein